MSTIQNNPNLVHDPVADLAALKAIDTTSYIDGVIVCVDSLGLFRFNSSSAETADDINIVDPTTGSGQWLRVTPHTYYVDGDGNAVFLNSSSSLISVQNGSSNTDFQLDASNNTNIIKGASTVMQFNSSGNANIPFDLSVTGRFSRSVASGITASATQTQGQQPLTKDINEISTVATTNDVVTMPSAATGKKVTIINNGANTLQIFPASGDDLGAGVDTSATLGAGEAATYISYDATNWVFQGVSANPVFSSIHVTGTSQLDGNITVGSTSQIDIGALEIKENLISTSSGTLALGSSTNGDVYVYMNKTGGSGGSFSVDPSNGVFEYDSQNKTLKLIRSSDVAGDNPMLHVSTGGDDVSVLARKTQSSSTGFSTEHIEVRAHYNASASPGNGFGGGIQFTLASNSVAATDLGYIGCKRDGADNSGTFVIGTNNAGSLSDKLVVTKEGTVGINNATPSTTTKLDVSGYVRSTSGFVGDDTNGLSLYGDIAASAYWQLADTGRLTFVGSSAGQTAARLDVSDGAVALRIGADSNTTTRTDNTAKYGRISSAHYTNAEESVLIAEMLSSGSENRLSIGGGHSGSNACTSVRFYAASGATTTTGSQIGDWSTFRLYTNTPIGIGVSTVTTNLGLDVSYNLARLGSDNTATTRTNSTRKESYILVPHYTTSEEDILFARVYSTGANNQITIGGGSSSYNAIVNGALMAAANDTTTNGTDIFLWNSSRIYSSVPLGIGSAALTPSASVDIADGGQTMLLGGDEDAKTRTDATAKFMEIAVPHYTNAEEPVMAMRVDANSSYTRLFIGGGSTTHNAATDVRIRVAATTTTTSGTDAFKLTSSALSLTVPVGINVSSPTGGLDISNNEIRFGSDLSATTRTNGSNKHMFVTTPHRTSAEENILFAYMQAGNPQNLLYIGGNSASYNSITNGFLYAGANNTTTTGTEVATWSTSGFNVTSGGLSTSADVDTTLGGECIFSSETGITASTTQTQGQRPLTKTMNTVTTVANANDVVTLPPAEIGKLVFVKNLGANTLQVYPASGDSVGGGAVNASTSIGTSSQGILFFANSDTDWSIK